MTARKQALVIETTDLTPIRNMTLEDETWLRQVSQLANTNELALTLSHRDDDEAEPVVFFDERSGCWWAGRYIGEVRYQGRTLRILPRFGMPQLHRWLSRIWGVRLVPSRGKYEGARVWLWKLLAKLWETRLLVAAKHGLPTFRLDELHYGQTVRGRLVVRLTAKEFSRGRHYLVSRTRNRHIDHRIAGIIVSAFENLSRELGDERSWLTPRAQNLSTQLRSHVTRQEIIASANSRVPTRYTPITESYREVVELSRAIARQQPFSSTAEGSNKVLGVLIDMAEIWELYVYHLLRHALQDIEIIHSGRDLNTSNWLLRSEQTGERLGRLKPDILILTLHSNRLLAILDAKYKTTTPTRERPHGILREDLYQITAYLSACGESTQQSSAALVYPSTKDTPNISALQNKNPWSLSASEGQLSFLTLTCEGSAGSGLQLSKDESAFVDSVQRMIDRGFPIKFAA